MSVPDCLELADLRTAIAKIALLSQVSASDFDRASKSSDEDIGGRRPSGGIDRKDDRDLDIPLKSVDYFNRKLRGCHTERAVAELLSEALTMLDVWKHSRRSDAEIVQRESFFWKCDVADDGPDSLDKDQRDSLRTKYTISTATLYRYREKYRGLRKRPSASAV